MGTTIFGLVASLLAIHSVYEHNKANPRVLSETSRLLISKATATENPTELLQRYARNVIANGFIRQFNVEERLDLHERNLNIFKDYLAAVTLDPNVFRGRTGERRNNKTVDPAHEQAARLLLEEGDILSKTIRISDKWTSGELIYLAAGLGSLYHEAISENSDLQEKIHDLLSDIRTEELRGNIDSYEKTAINSKISRLRKKIIEQTTSMAETINAEIDNWKEKKGIQ